MNRKETPDILADVLGPAPTAPQWLALDEIRSDGGTQMRAALDQVTVSEYVELMGTGFNDAGPFPPIVVFHDGQEYWLADGFHRVEAARRKGTRLKITMSIPADVRAGTRRDAILYAAQANANHGLRRTSADKQRAVDTLLRDPDWSQWSNMEIARRCGVDEKTVRNYRSLLAMEMALPLTSENPKSATGPFPSPPPIMRRGADGRTINTANIGRQQTARYAEIWQLQKCAQAVSDKLVADDVPLDIIAADMRRCASQREGETWRLLKRDLSANSLDWRVPDLAQAMNNEANRLEQLVNPPQRDPVRPPPPAQPVRPHWIGLAAWELMGDTDMRENARLLNDLAIYKGEDQVVIVEALQGGTVGTVASAAEAFGIVKEIPREPLSTAMRTDLERHQAQPKLEPNPDVVQMAAVAAKSNRITDFIRLRQAYLATLDSLERFGELTGRATLTLPAKRAVTDLLDVVNAELRDLGA